MSDADEIEGLLLQAAGTRRPSSADISPILALIEEGYDLDRDILPGIRENTAKAGEAISSWRYFVPAIKRRRTTKAIGALTGQETSIDGDFADGPRPVYWIRGTDPRYGALAARWAVEQTKRQKGKKAPRPAPILSKYFKGEGWAFPAAWVDDVLP
jgi:hypothetical protein